MTWLERFAEARVRGHFTTDDRQAACSWLSCAVGEHGQQGTLIPVTWAKFGPDTFDHVGPYHKDGTYPSPIDYTLKHHGYEFYDLIKNNRIDEAEALYHAIGDRVLELKREAS